MEDLLVFFCGIDPGKQLKPVLAFKQELEATKRHFHHQFDEVRGFCLRLTLPGLYGHLPKASECAERGVCVETKASEVHD